MAQDCECCLAQQGHDVLKSKMGPILKQKPPPKLKNYAEASKNSESDSESSGERNEDNDNN